MSDQIPQHNNKQRHQHSSQLSGDTGYIPTETPVTMDTIKRQKPQHQRQEPHHHHSDHHHQLMTNSMYSGSAPGYHGNNKAHPYYSNGNPPHPTSSVMGAGGYGTTTTSDVRNSNSGSMTHSVVGGISGGFNHQHNRQKSGSTGSIGSSSGGSRENLLVTGEHQPVKQPLVSLCVVLARFSTKLTF